MFLTRMGFNSKAVITGDITQIDLPNSKRSGMVEAMDILRGVNGISTVTFDDTDVVRHHLVQRIIRAYDDFKSRQETPQLPFPHAGGNGKARESAPPVPPPEQLEHDAEPGGPAVE